MNEEDVVEELLKQGSYCRKGNSGCFCAVGWPVERLCPDCGPDRDLFDMRSFCVCPPKA
jgi:hypothetical protein